MEIINVEHEIENLTDRYEYEVPCPDISYKEIIIILKITICDQSVIHLEFLYDADTNNVSMNKSGQDADYVSSSHEGVGAEDFELLDLDQEVELTITAQKIYDNYQCKIGG